MQKPLISFEQVANTTQIEVVAHLADEIWHECYAEILSLGQIDYMIQNMQSPAAIKSDMQKNGYEYFIICFGNIPVGYTAVRAAGGKLLLSKLYVLAAHRGKGIARSAMWFIEELARKRNCFTIWLTVNKNNLRAISVYEKTGFKRTRSQMADIGAGFMMDDYVYEKEV